MDAKFYPLPRRHKAFSYGGRKAAPVLKNLMRKEIHEEE
jgi:hypothetical protein